MVARIEQTSDSLLKQLLRHDLSAFAAKLDLASPGEPLPGAIVARLLNLAEEFSRSLDDELRNRCLLICGLLWEHRSHEWKALPQFIMNLLSRIGLAPSMQMVDEEFQHYGGRYQPWGSTYVEAAIAARSFEHEVIVAGTSLVLSEFQFQVWNAMSEWRRLGISAPTSAGKSFVLLYKALDLLNTEPGPVVYVVPTLSLIQQVTKDFHSAVRRLKLPHIEVLQTYSERPEGSKTVYVLTQERALAALSDHQALRNIGLLIIDEVQNVERAADEDEERAHTLFDVLQELVATRSPVRAVISGPRVENIAQLTEEFFGPNSTSITQALPPVLNLTYSFTKVGKSRVVLRQYASGFDSPEEMVVKDPEKVAIKAFGKQRYDENVLNFLGSIVRKSGDEGTLIFSPTSSQATRTALSLAEQSQWNMNDQRVDELREYVDETVHPNYALRQCLPSGVAFHHGKMPLHIRVAVEQAFSALDIRVLACTTTLMQGVNLPAKNLIARNPNLFVTRRGEGATLTPYEFANLRGRAGRLLKDFVGRAIVLDENAFNQEEMDFDFPEKTVQAGYGSRFEQHREQIVESLRIGSLPVEGQQNHDLVVWIRQSILRFGERALHRLAQAGIEITDDEYEAAARQVRGLSVPKEVCARAPYWDPLVLEQLFLANMRGQIPRVPPTPFTANFVQDFTEVLSAMRQLAPFYFSKYLGEDNPKVIYSICIAAQKWSAENPLKSIISWGKEFEPPTWEEIDRRIARVNQDVAHDVPKLLRPLVAMQDEENGILGLMEVGAFKPETRRLIELGIPRETAIRVAARVRLPSAAAATDSAMMSAARVGSTQLNYWERTQIESLLPN